MKIDRRYFVQLAGIAVGELVVPSINLHGQEPSSIDLLRLDPRRPQFHLLPARNWMNDPNGPIFLDGKYHMFFQYNPEAPVWGNMSWNHAVSEDMVHWQLLSVGLTPTPNGPDAAGCFSGSTIAVKHDGRTRVYAIYTGVVRDKENETIRNEGLKETQCLAWSDDPSLRHWQKRTDPVIARPPQHMKVTGFRDPSVWKHGNEYLMALGAGLEQVGGCVLLYCSRDLFHWEYLHPLAIGSWNGIPTSNPVDDGEMWECPEIFALGDRHVLIYSSLRKVFWQSGVLDPATLRFTASNGGLLDVGAFYAPKTQLDAKGRRVLWGWVPEHNTETEMTRAGWSGIMGLPRILALDDSGNLRITPLPELATLRRKSIPSQTDLNGAMLKVPESKGEVLCTSAAGSSISLSIDFASEKFGIHFSPDDGRIALDDKTIVLAQQRGMTVHVFIDGSVAEIFVNDSITITKRFYYEGNRAPDIIVRAKGSSFMLMGRELASISTDRMTTVQADI